MMELAEKIAKDFHEIYEKLASSFGYETRKDSAVPWEDLPDKNKSLMIAVVTELLSKDGNPLANLEEEHMTKSLGKMAYLVYRGALNEGASASEAFFVTSAYFRGMIGGSMDSTDE